MSAGDGVRWDPRQNVHPRGLLQNSQPPRSLAEAQRQALLRNGITSPHKVTESNPAGIYVPPGDPLHRPPVPPRPWRFWRDPITWGSIAGFLVIGTALYFLAGS